MSELKERQLKGWNAEYDYDYVIDHIKIPENPGDIPNILGWSGPARSGTTALLFLLAGHPKVDRVYFQPQKTLMRFGGPDLELYDEDRLVCMKETFLSWKTEEEPHDPIETLLQAGVPAEKITWIALLRDPLQAYASWERLEPGYPPEPEVFAFWQAHTIDLFHKYENTDVNIIPFTYESLDGQEERAIKAVLAKAVLDTDNFTLNFNDEAIEKKLVPGQAADKDYFEKRLGATIRQGRLVYKPNSYIVESTVAKRIKELCQEEYDTFHQLVQRELAL